MLINVVLPAPLGPSSAKISPRRMSRLMFFKAWNPDAYTLERFEIEMTDCMRVFFGKMLAAQCKDKHGHRQPLTSKLDAWRRQPDIQSRMAGMQQPASGRSTRLVPEPHSAAASPLPALRLRHSITL